jgi:abortive infection bacteriophage resistance protein
MRTSLGHFFINHIFDKLLKLPKTIEEQIALLDERGIGIDDYDQLRDTLINNNYYRLMGYMFQFKIDEESYTKGIKFSQIFGIYNFDKSLRQLISPLLEIIEISFRTKIAYFMCHKTSFKKI